MNQDRRIVAYAAKGTWQMASGHRLDASFFGDPAVGDNGPQRYTALLRTDTAGFSKLDHYGGHNQTVRYEGAVTPTWLLEGSFARAKNSIVEIPSVDQWSTIDNTVTPQVRSGGIGFFEVGNSGVNWQYQAKATNVIHHHNLRYGVEYENIDYANTINRTGPTFTLVDGTSDGHWRARSRSTPTRPSGGSSGSSAPTPATCATRRSITSTSSRRTAGPSATA